MKNGSQFCDFGMNTKIEDFIRHNEVSFLFLVLNQAIFIICFLEEVVPIEKLLEREKQTLSLVLREKIFESQDLEQIIKLEIKRVEGEPAKVIFLSALKHVQETRDDCYNIAKKLGIK